MKHIYFRNEKGKLIEPKEEAKGMLDFLAEEHVEGLNRTRTEKEKNAGKVWFTEPK